MQTPSSRILFSTIIDILFIYPYKDDARGTAPVHDVIHHSTAKNSALSSLSYARPGIHSLLLGMTELRCWVSCSMSAYRPGPMHPSMIPSPTSANNSSSPKILMECRSCTLQPHAASPRERERGRECVRVRVCVCVLHHGAELPMGSKCMHTMNRPENSLERERESCIATHAATASRYCTYLPLGTYLRYTKTPQHCKLKETLNLSTVYQTTQQQWNHKAELPPPRNPFNPKILNNDLSQHPRGRACSHHLQQHNDTLLAPKKDATCS